MTFTVNHERDWESASYGHRLSVDHLVIWVPKDAETVTTELRGPLKVGDVIDSEDWADVMDDTPPLTILSAEDGFVFQKSDLGVKWYDVLTAKSMTSEQVIREAKPLTVLRVGR